MGNQFYKDVAGTFLLLVLDYEKLSAKVIWGDLGTGVHFFMCLLAGVMDVDSCTVP